MRGYSKVEANLVVYDKNTGEPIDREVLNSLVRDDYFSEMNALSNINPKEMTNDEITRYRKFKKLPSVVEYKHQKYYITSMSVKEKFLSLSIETQGMIGILGFYCSMGGWIKSDNNKLIDSWEDLRKMCNISDRTWRKVKKEIDEYDIVKKINIKNRSYMIINPMFSNTTNEITEMKFIAFYEMWKTKLPPIDYEYLCRIYGNPER